VGGDENSRMIVGEVAHRGNVRVERWVRPILVRIELQTTTFPDGKANDKKSQGYPPNPITKIPWDKKPPNDY
jgi:hypothetical protein